jgi:hypothetical protein
MKAKVLFLLSGLFLVLGLACIIGNWHGTAGASLALPLSGSSVQLSGSATGGWAVLGLSGLVMGILLFVVALIVAFLVSIPRRKKEPPLPIGPE